MSEKRTGGVGMFCLWAGAAISLAEILTGSVIAPLGIGTGIIVILAGHLIGCAILALTGFIGFKEGKPALESSRLAFGKYGSYIISVFNIIQLVGWTAVMLIQCSDFLDEILKGMTGRTAFTAFVIITGVLVMVWVLFADKGISIVNSAAVVLLFALCLVILVLILGSHGVKAAVPASGALSVGAALEMSIVMPLSWLPLISDYTMRAKSARGSFWGSFAGYFAGSSFMYIIGLVAAVYTGSDSFGGVIMRLGLGAAGLVVAVLATVTTTYLDVYSAVMSTLNITKKIPKRLLIVIISALGTAAALILPMAQYTNFLYAIGSIFAPVFSIVLTDYFFFHADRSAHRINWAAIVCAAVGTAVYYMFVNFDLIICSTVPSMLASATLYAVIRLIIKKVKPEEN